MNKAQKRNNPNLVPQTPRRIRQIRPEFWEREEVAELPPWARLAFIGIWNFCDRLGRFHWRPRTLKVKIFPHDDVDFAACLETLQQHNFVFQYTVDGEDYGVVVGWEKFQMIADAEARTDPFYPPPPNSHCSSSAQSMPSECSSTDQNSRERERVRVRRRERVGFGVSQKPSASANADPEANVAHEPDEEMTKPISFSPSDQADPTAAPEPLSNRRIFTVSEAYETNGLRNEGWYDDGGINLLKFLSDDLFNPRFLSAYKHRQELQNAGEEAITEMAGAPLADRAVLGTLCGKVMDKLAEQHIKAPDYWTKLLKILRTGGPVESYSVHCYDDEQSSRTTGVTTVDSNTGHPDPFPF